MQWLGYTVLLVCVTAVSQGSSDPRSNRPDRAPLPFTETAAQGPQYIFDSHSPTGNGNGHHGPNLNGNGKGKGTNGDSFPRCLLSVSTIVSDRLQLLRQKSTEAAASEITYGVAVALDEVGQTFYKGQKKSPVAEWDPQLQTVRYFSSIEHQPNKPREIRRYASNSKVFMPVAHGNGAWYSHSGPMLDFVTLATRASKKRSGSTRSGNLPSLRETLFEQYPDLVIAAEAKDDPGHGMGPDPAKFPSIHDWIEWEAKYLREVKSFGLPVVPLAKSGSTAKYLQLIQKYPDLVDGLILISPVHPTIKHHEDVARLYQFVQDGEFVPNLWGFEWAVQMVRQMDFDRNPNPYNGVPVLTMYGGMDYEVSREVYAEFDRLARNVPVGDIARSVRIPGGGHNLLATQPNYPTGNDLLYLYQLHAKPEFHPDTHPESKPVWLRLRGQLKSAFEALGTPLPANWETEWANLRTSEAIYARLLPKLQELFNEVSDFEAPTVRELNYAPLDSHLAIYDFLHDEVLPRFQRNTPPPQAPDNIPLYEPNLQREVAQGELPLNPTPAWALD